MKRLASILNELTKPKWLRQTERMIKEYRAELAKRSAATELPCNQASDVDKISSDGPSDAIICGDKNSTLQP